MQTPPAPPFFKGEVMSKQKAGDLTTVTGNHHSRYSRNMKRTIEKITGGAFTKNKEVQATTYNVAVGTAVLIFVLLVLVCTIIVLVRL